MSLFHSDFLVLKWMSIVFFKMVTFELSISFVELSKQVDIYSNVKLFLKVYSSNT